MQRLTLPAALGDIAVGGDDTSNTSSSKKIISNHLKLPPGIIRCLVQLRCVMVAEQSLVRGSLPWQDRQDARIQKLFYRALLNFIPQNLSV